MARRKSIWILSVTALATGLIFMDNTIVPIALPSIEKDLNFSSTSSLWIVNCYLLSMVALFLIGGRLADLFGKKRCYLIGLSLFGLGSTISGLSFDHASLFSGRIIQGMGGALIGPATGALLISYFPTKRAAAIGINTGISSFFMMIGPIIGGVLTQWLSWRSVFWMNLPLVIFAILLSSLLLKKESRGEGRFDFTGVFPLICSLFSLVLAFMQAPSWGWTSYSVLSLFALSVLFFILFVHLSKKTEFPLLDLNILKSSQFRVAVSSIFLIQMIVMLSVFFPIFWQKGRGFDPLDSGMIMMVASFPVLFSAPLAGFLSDKLSARLPVSIGFLLVLFSLLWVFCFTDASILKLAPALFGFGFGIPMIFSPAFATALSSVTTERLGSASSLVTTIRQVAGTLGLAIMSAVYNSTFDDTGSYEAALSSLLMMAAFFSVAGLVLSQRIKI